MIELLIFINNTKSLGFTSCFIVFSSTLNEFIPSNIQAFQSFRFLLTSYILVSIDFHSRLSISIVMMINPSLPEVDRLSVLDPWVFYPSSKYEKRAFLNDLDGISINQLLEESMKTDPGLCDPSSLVLCQGTSQSGIDLFISFALMDD